MIYVKPFLPRTRAIKRRGCVKVIEAWPGEGLSLSLSLSKLARFRHVPATVTMLNVWPGTEDVLPGWMRFRASISGRVGIGTGRVLATLLTFSAYNHYEIKINLHSKYFPNY